jgi:hypothetical protein
MGKIVLAAALAMGALAAPASATVTIGSYTFDDNAFVDQLTGSSGSYTTSGGTVADVETDKDPYTWAFTRDAGAYLDLAFTDNLAFNGVGNDIALFEIGVPDAWNVIINGVTHTYTSAPTGVGTLNVVAFDLSDFGIVDGGTINSLRLTFVDNQAQGTVPTTSLVGALNSTGGAVPEPATWAMMLLGFGAIGCAMRRRGARALRAA